MHETAVQLQVPIDVPERVLPVTVIQMCIAAEHLLDNASDVGMEIGRKAGGFADPVVLLARELGERSGERSGRGSNGSSGGVGGRRGCVTGGEGGRGH